MSNPLDWRGKSVRLLTADEVVAFAEWAYREIEILRNERDAYLGRALAAEDAMLGPRRRPDYDTLAEREMDLGDKFERLTRED